MLNLKRIKISKINGELADLLYLVFFILLSLIVVDILFISSNEVPVFLFVFLLYWGANKYFKWKLLHIVKFAIVLVLLSWILLLLGNKGASEKSAVWAYLTLVIGFVKMLSLL